MSFFQGLLPGIFGRMEDPTKVSSSSSPMMVHKVDEDMMEEDRGGDTAATGSAMEEDVVVVVPVVGGVSHSASSSLHHVVPKKPSSRKRNRSTGKGSTSGGTGSTTTTSATGTRTPTLLETPGDKVGPEEKETPPAKRRRGLNDQSIPVLQEEVREEEKKEKCYIAKLPEDILTNVLSFCSGVSDRFALQCTSKQFKRISDKDEMRIGIEVGGDKKTGLHGIISETDTPDSAAVKLRPYVRAGNLEAIYMLGIIKCYCDEDVEGGISLLRMASDQGYVRGTYALGLVMRDTHPDEANKYMKSAADSGYIPALQEILSARTMKAKYGEPHAEELRHFLDPICLSRLLSRHYVRSAGLRNLNTSHCWNPLCGRWACKATMNGAQQNRQRRHAARRWEAVDRQRNADIQAGLPSVAQRSAGARGGAGNNGRDAALDHRVSRMKMCSRCCRAKYCSKLCQVYDWRSGRHKMECQFL